MLTQMGRAREEEHQLYKQRGTCQELNPKQRGERKIPDH